MSAESESVSVISSMTLSTKVLIVAVILLGAALYYVYNSLQTFKGSVSSVFQNIQDSMAQPDVNEEEEEEDVNKEE